VAASAAKYRLIVFIFAPGPCCLYPQDM